MKIDIYIYIYIYLYIYIYISEGPKGCIYGFLTNRDDKSEVVQEWIIISGKEYCKGIIHWSLF